VVVGGIGAKIEAEEEEEEEEEDIRLLVQARGDCDWPMPMPMPMDPNDDDDAPTKDAPHDDDDKDDKDDKDDHDDEPPPVSETQTQARSAPFVNRISPWHATRAGWIESTVCMYVRCRNRGEGRTEFRNNGGSARFSEFNQRSELGL
jgi:hypothetical protein